MTLWADVDGPLGKWLGEHHLLWRATLRSRHFLEGHVVGITDDVQIEFEVSAVDLLPFDSGLSLNGSVILGEDVSGYFLGLGMSF